MIIDYQYIVIDVYQLTDIIFNIQSFTAFNVIRFSEQIDQAPP